MIDRTDIYLDEETLASVAQRAERVLEESKPRSVSRSMLHAYEEVEMAKAVLYLLAEVKRLEREVREMEEYEREHGT